jgi:hypothetical protein
MTVTKQGQKLRHEALRRLPHPLTEYTIDGPVRERVDSSVLAEYRRDTLAGDRILRQALEDLRREQAFATRYGMAKAQFNRQEEIKL